MAPLLQGIRVLDFGRYIAGPYCAAMLAEYGADARLIAGGQSLMAVLNMRLAQPKLLIDINHVAELAYIERRKDYLAVGAGVRQAQLLARSTLMDEVPLLALAWWPSLVKRTSLVGWPQ